MNATPKLTIAVPTYDRPKQLERCLRAIAPQLTNECKLLVADNASATSASDVLKSIGIPYETEQCETVRHRYNIGAVGNVMFCFYYPATEWVWVLGDDDIACSDAVSRILSAIEEHDSAKAIVFNVAEFPDSKGRTAPLADRVFTDTEDFVGSHALYCSSLISSGVYNLRYVRRTFCVAYDFASSFYPHTAWLLNTIQNNSCCIPFYSNPIVHFVNDGMRESDMSPILKNMQYLARMLKSTHSRKRFLNNSFMAKFAINSAQNSPTFANLICATAFRECDTASGFISRERRRIAELLEFRNAGELLPYQALRAICALTTASLAGALLAPLLRLAFRYRNRGQKEAPLRLTDPTNRTVP